MLTDKAVTRKTPSIPLFLVLVQPWILSPQIISSEILIPVTKGLIRISDPLVQESSSRYPRVLCPDRGIQGSSFRLAAGGVQMFQFFNYSHSYSCFCSAVYVLW